jgi:uncharacterized membrane protein SirB2
MKSMVYKTISVVLLVVVGMIIMAASHKQESQKKQEIFDRNAATVKALCGARPLSSFSQIQILPDSPYG